MDPPGRAAGGRPTDDDHTEIEDTALAEHPPPPPTIRGHALARPAAPASRSAMSILVAAVLALVALAVIAGLAFRFRSPTRTSPAAGRAHAPASQGELREEIAATIRESLAHRDDARRLCGFAVTGVTDIDVRVTATTGTLATGSGRADVTATGVPAPGGANASTRCAAGMAFRYEVTASATNVTLDHLFQPIAIGATAAGVLDAADERSTDDRFADEYALDLAEGQTVTLVARGGPSTDDPARKLDVDLFALHDGHSVDDDDGAGDLDARLVLQSPHAGTWFIVVSTAAGATTGRYTLQVIVGVDATSLPAASTH